MCSKGKSQQRLLERVVVEMEQQRKDTDAEFRKISMDMQSLAREVSSVVYLTAGMSIHLLCPGHTREAARIPATVSAYLPLRLHGSHAWFAGVRDPYFFEDAKHWLMAQRRLAPMETGDLTLNL